MGLQLSAQGAIIKTAYEAEANTNAYTDAEVAKLAGIVPGVATTNVFKIPGSLARGDIFYINASGNLVRLPAGDTGKFLKTQGTTGDPVWEALPGGGDMLQATYDPNGDGIIAIAQGGSGQATAQAAIDALTQIAGATNEHVLTKDTTTGNATWKVGGAGGASTWVELTDTPSSIIAYGLCAGNSAGTELIATEIGININRLYSRSDVHGVLLQGGSHAESSYIHIEGPGGSDTGATQFHQYQDATHNVEAGYFEGATATPKLHLLHGLDMHTKKIENLLDGVAATDAATVSQANTRYIQVEIYDPNTAVAVGTKKAMVHIPFAGTLTGVHARVDTPSSGGTPTFDIEKNGATVFSTLLTIDQSENGSEDAAIPAVISDSAIAENDVYTFDVDAAGTSTKGLVITCTAVMT